MFQDSNAVYIRTDTTRRTLRSVLAGESGRGLMHLWEYARLAAHIYNEEDSGKMGSVLPDGFPWQQCATPFPQKKKNLKLDLTGLKVETWFKEVPTQSTTFVAIVVRGTRFAVLNDWFAGNLVWITQLLPLINDYYTQIIELSQEFIESLSKELEGKTKYKLSFSSVGHSLGGGLAHCFGYSHSEIKSVYAFNSSPVTAYTWMSAELLKKTTKGLKVYRCYERGEVLAYIRKVTDIFAYKLSSKPNHDPRFTECCFNFDESKHPIRGHSIESLATNLEKAAKQFGL